MTAELVAIDPCAPTRSNVDFVSRVAAAAVRHPNGHPWHLRPVDHGYEIRADHSRGTRLTGLGARTVRLTVGAALLNLRLAVAVSGHQPVAAWSFDRPRSDVVAVVRRGVQRDPTPVERALFTAIAPGTSTRRLSGAPPLATAVLGRARSAVEAEGVWLRSVVGQDQDLRGPSFAAVPRSAHLVAIGGNHDVAAVHLRAGLALQRLVLTVQALGWHASVAGWPVDLTTVPNLQATIGGPGVHPQVVVGIWPPSDSITPV